MLFINLLLYTCVRIYSTFFQVRSVQVVFASWFLSADGQGQSEKEMYVMLTSFYLELCLFASSSIHPDCLFILAGAAPAMTLPLGPILTGIFSPVGEVTLNGREPTGPSEIECNCACLCFLFCFFKVQVITCRLVCPSRPCCTRTVKRSGSVRTVDIRYTTNWKGYWLRVSQLV